MIHDHANCTSLRLNPHRIRSRAHALRVDIDDVDVISFLRGEHSVANIFLRLRTDPEICMFCPWSPDFKMISAAATAGRRARARAFVSQEVTGAAT